MSTYSKLQQQNTLSDINGKKISLTKLVSAYFFPSVCYFVFFSFNHLYPLYTLSCIYSVCSVLPDYKEKIKYTLTAGYFHLILLNEILFKKEKKILIT